MVADSHESILYHFLASYDFKSKLLVLEPTGAIISISVMFSRKQPGVATILILKSVPSATQALKNIFNSDDKSYRI